VPAAIIDGKAIAEQIRQEVKKEAATLLQQRGIIPGLVVILVGDHPASAQYVTMKGKACVEVGFYSVTQRHPSDISERALFDLIGRCNNDPKIHGILVQMPLPKHINEQKIVESIDPHKDVDGFHPYNVGRLVIGEDSFVPCTPAGIVELLMRSGNPPDGKHVVVVGRSNIVGKPVANLLIQKSARANAIVTVVHTGTKDIARYTRMADILIAAMGKPEIITGDMIKEGAVVIDVGSNRIEDPSQPKGYRFVGDVHFASASQRAKAITPAPGGVGPMTIAMLLKNTLKAAMSAA
jgi:methylenetetrahydrofolate dehydrogenase (NADP+)/methenyltetrahydrofolate cyclohydrolase